MDEDGAGVDRSAGARVPAERRGAVPARILLVEDDEDTRQLLAIALGTERYSVAQACDAAEAVVLLRANTYDLVISDYDLPGETGAALLKRATGDGLLRETATVMITAHPQPEGWDEADIIRKPLDLRTFLVQIQQLLESRVRPHAGIALDVAGPALKPIELVLYVSPGSLPSIRAVQNLQSLLADFADQVELTICDLARNPAEAEQDHVVFTPTLVKRRPIPRTWILGDFSDPAVLADLLHMCGAEAPGRPSGIARPTLLPGK